MFVSMFIRGCFDSPYTNSSFFNVNQFVCLDYEVIDENKVYYALIRSYGDNLHKVYIAAHDYFKLTGVQPDDLDF